MSWKEKMQIQDYLIRLLEHAGVQEPNVNVEENDEQLEIQLNVPEEDVGMLIGYHGETLSSIQRILRIIYRDEIEKRISLNINDYKEKRQEKLLSLAENYAQRALESGQEQIFPYLPSNERFIIHSIIGENPEYSKLETVSEGEGKNRRLVIKIKNDK